MFSLIHGLWEMCTSRPEVRVLIVGLERAGKTTLLEQIKGAYIGEGAGLALSAIQPTVGMNLGRVPLLGVDATFWDVGGAMRAIWEQFYAGADCIIFVVDAADRACFGEAASTLELVLQRAEECATRAPLVVVANKGDKADKGAGGAPAARAAELADAVCRPAGLVPAAELSAAGAGAVAVAGAGAGGGAGAGSGAGSGVGGGAGAGAGAAGKDAGADAGAPGLALQQAYSLLPGRRHERPPAHLRRDIRVFEASALTLEGVREAIDFAVAAAKRFQLERDGGSVRAEKGSA